MKLTDLEQVTRNLEIRKGFRKEEELGFKIIEIPNKKIRRRKLRIRNRIIMIEELIREK